MACEPQELQDASRCFECLSEKELTAIIAYLLCQIQDGGLAPLNLRGDGSPVGVVVPAAEGQFYTDRSNVPMPVLWQASGLTSADWQQIV